FKTDNDAVYARLWPENSGNPPLLWTDREISGEFAASARFEPVVHRVVPWETSYTSAAWVRLLGTHSDHRMLPADVPTQLHREIGALTDKRGGACGCVYATNLFAARRLSPRA